jgi:cation:H+ antiporter
MLDSTAPLSLAIPLFLAAAAAIGLAGTRMAGLADRIADRSGLGEAMVGGIFLGATTSLPGIAASVTAALDGLPSLAVSNAIGGIAAQTVFLAVADLFYRRANLEHAAASVPNLVHATMLVILLTLVMLFITGPAWPGRVHPGTWLLILAYLLGLRLAFRSSSSPMWYPRKTSLTRTDVPDGKQQQESLLRLVAEFAGVALVVLVAGMTIARAAGTIVHTTGISESVMGGVFTAISTSLPELVTTVAAVRRGALTLAVSDIVGGNAFDVLFLCMADVAYAPGSIYHAVGASELFFVGVALLLNLVLLLGLIHREERGLANIGFESVLVIAIYALGTTVLALWPGR